MNVTTGQQEADEHNPTQTFDGTFGDTNGKCDNNLLENKEIFNIQKIAEKHDNNEPIVELAKAKPVNIENTAAAVDAPSHPQKECESSGTSKTGVQKITKKSPIKINPALKQFLKDVRQLKVSENPEDAADSSTQSKPLAFDAKTEVEIAEIPASEADLSAESSTNQGSILAEDEGGIVIDPDDETALENTPDGSEIAENDQFDRLFEAGCSRNSDPSNIHELMVPQDTSGCSETATRASRSKSAEPEKKRKLSLDSRKSLSGLGLMKKIREVSDKVTHALSVENFKQLFRPAEGQQPKETPKKEPKLVKKELKAKTDNKLKKGR